MKILGIIPSRYASTRFPGKSLANIAGKSMIQRVYEQVIQVEEFSKIIVATDDERIVNHVQSFGGIVMMTSPFHQSGTDRCGEIVSKLDEEFDLVINIQGDEPFIEPVQIKQLIQAFTQKEISIATLAKRITDLDQLFNENVVKIVSSVTGKALYFSRLSIPFLRGINQTEWLSKAKFYKHIGLYAYKSSVLKNLINLTPSSLENAESLEQLRWLENNFSIQVVETMIETIGVDTPEDIVAIEYAMKFIK